ncbi:MAG: flagellar basal body-associated FliL family protein [Piscirickettsiaceae bacterium]|nr:flagellar basal body-associated FliL family protein [Piscirickettsiaceae bacterium]
MAETQDDIDATEESGGKSKKMMIIIAVVVLALIGGGAMMFLGGGDDAASDEKAENVAPVKQAAIYSEVKDPFIVNFSQQSNDVARYLQVKLKVMARDQAVIDAVQLHMPVIQHEFLLLLYSQNYDDLTTNGTKALKVTTLTLINDILKAENVENELKAVYFTSFLMQ